MHLIHTIHITKLLKDLTSKVGSFIKYIVHNDLSRVSSLFYILFSILVLRKEDLEIFTHRYFI
jgi:hypothetical protein